MALESIRPLIPSRPSATRGVPRRILPAHALRTPQCCSFFPSVSIFSSWALTVEKGSGWETENSGSDISYSRAVS